MKRTIFLISIIVFCSSCLEDIECPAFDLSKFAIEWLPIRPNTEKLTFIDSQGIKHELNETNLEISQPYTIERSWTPGQSTTCFSSSTIALSSNKYRIESELRGSDEFQSIQLTLVDSISNRYYFRIFSDNEIETDTIYDFHEQLTLNNDEFQKVYQFTWTDSTSIFISSNTGIVGFILGQDTFSLQ